MRLSPSWKKLGSASISIRQQQIRLAETKFYFDYACKTIRWYTKSSSSSSSSYSTSSSSSSPSFVCSVDRYDIPVRHHVHSRHLPAGLSLSSNVRVRHGKGSWVESIDGRHYLDFTSGIGVTNLGHSHPRLIDAAHKQIEKGVHLQINCITSEPLLELADKIGEILPSSLKNDYQVLFSNSGAESIENAVKLARVATKRQTVIVFQGGFHGRTIGAGALTTAKYVYRSGFQPTMSGVYVSPFAYCHRCALHQSSPEEYNLSSCCNQPIEQLRLLLKQQTGVDEVAAILIEPILGEGGYVVPPISFLQAVREIADDIGALLILDEVQSGYGRTGNMFACQGFNVKPDILVMAKGIANGFPLSAIATKSSILSAAKPGSIGGTYGGNALSCAVACAVIDTFKEENILSNVNARGEELRRGLKRLSSIYPISDVRGIGLMNSIEFDSSQVEEGTAGKIVKAAVDNGLLLLTAGVYESIRFIPPLTISKSEMTEGLEKLENALKQTIKPRNAAQN